MPISVFLAPARDARIDDPYLEQESKKRQGVVVVLGTERSPKETDPKLRRMWPREQAVASEADASATARRVQGFPLPQLPEAGVSWRTWHAPREE